MSDEYTQKEATRMFESDPQVLGRAINLIDGYILLLNTETPTGGVGTVYTRLEGNNEDAIHQCMVNFREQNQQGNDGFDVQLVSGDDTRHGDAVYEVVFHPRCDDE